MNNPIFNAFGGFNNFIGQFNQFKQNMLNMQQNGFNPQQHVQQLLDSGQMTQDQFNRLSGMAKQIQEVIK